ncbi:MAG: hypothetical protein HYY57_01465 [Candidatus Omnitrophica bacterium]|nr:hypothetical protein [Candidatus Omnitrophota bacterium]
MTGSFIIRLYDFLVYLLPGVLVLSASLYGASLLIPLSALIEHKWFLPSFLLVSYLVGHPLFVLSELVSKADYWVSGRRRMTDRAIENASFYGDMVKRLEHYLGQPLKTADITGFCFRIVCEKMPACDQVVDRLLAVMLFSRSMVASLVLTVVILAFALVREFSVEVLAATLLATVCACLLFSRYRTQYWYMLITCWRSAYLWLVEKDVHGVEKKTAVRETEVRTNG